MRCSFFRAFVTQLKRSFRLLPAALVATAFLCLAIGCFAFFVLKTDSESEEKSFLRVAYVGSLSDYMGINLDSVVNLVSEQFGVTVEKLSKEDAESEMFMGHLTTYLIFPDGFVESVDDGSNDRKITYVTAEGEKGIAGTILSESIDSVSDIMTTSQSAFYAAYDFLTANNRRDMYYDAGATMEELMLRSIMGVMDSSEVETVGVSNGLSFKGYYTCAVILIYVSLSGLGAVAFFTNRNTEFQRIIRRSGQNEVKQVFQEFFAFIMLEFMCGLVLYFSLKFCISKGYLQVTEFGRYPVQAYKRFVLRVIPSALMLYSFQFLFYELIENTISAVLVQFIAAVSLGYISGFYYPIDFLPNEITKFSRFLPTGVAFRYISGEMASENAALWVGLLIAYFAVFMALSVLIRLVRLRRDV